MRRALHLFLLGKGVTQITVTYSGSGDSGGFDDFNYEGGPEAIEDELVEIEDGKGGTQDREPAPGARSDARPAAG